MMSRLAVAEKLSARNVCRAGGCSEKVQGVFLIHRVLNSLQTALYL